MTKESFDKLCMICVERVKQFAPIDTGNLRYNAIRYEWIDENTFKIYVDGTPDNKNSIAPYMPYTNEPWISKKWNGKKNPNEGWWQKAIEDISQFIIEEFDGEIDND